MKKLISILVLLLTAAIYAQVPQAIPYQGLIKNGAIPLANTTVCVKVSILNGSTDVYREIHHPTTTALGVYGLMIGQGTPESGAGLVAFNQLSWSSANLQLKIQVDQTNACSSYSQSTTTPFLTVPYAFMAKSAATTNSFNVKTNLAALRTAAGAFDGDLVYVKGHTTTGDGGEGFFMWKTHAAFLPGGVFGVDNNGTIIQASGVTTGKWVRQYEGYINAAFFGAFGTWGNYTTALQSAIDFARLIITPGTNPGPKPFFQSNTVYLPNGNYIVDKITLKDGVSILGENMEYTNIFPSSAPGDYLVDMEIGVVAINMWNLNFKGDSGSGKSTKGVFNFNATLKDTSQIEGYGFGGIMNSTFKNIQIRDFQGTAINLGGGTTTYAEPNQFNTFENIRVCKGNLDNDSYALYLEGENGQYRFTNCRFDGGTGTTYSKGKNVYLKGVRPNSNTLDPAVITFVNCAFSNGDYGVYMRYAEGISFDNCMFQNLGIGVYSDGGLYPNKAISIVNSRFDNAAGYGSLTVPTGYIKNNGACIKSSAGVLNVSGNYITAGSFCSSCNFIEAYGDLQGISVTGNTFSSNAFNKTSGVIQLAAQSGSVLFCNQNLLLTVLTSATAINSIDSTANTGEIITFIAAGGTVVFNKTSAITFPGSGTTLTLNSGEVAQFRRTDMAGSTQYQLVSVVRNNP